MPKLTLYEGNIFQLDMVRTKIFPPLNKFHSDKEYLEQGSIYWGIRNQRGIGCMLSNQQN